MKTRGAMGQTGRGAASHRSSFRHRQRVREPCVRLPLSGHKFGRPLGLALLGWGSLGSHLGAEVLLRPVALLWAHTGIC